MTRIRRGALVALFTLIGLVIVPIGLLDLFQPDLDIAGCTSDNLAVVAGAVREYRSERGGKLPVAARRVSAVPAPSQGT